MTPPPSRRDPPEWPEYCCAILRDAAGRYLLEHRPESAKDAPGLLTCFGGKRNPGEHPDRCIRREIWEELHWRVGALRMKVAVRLLGPDGRVVAWFYSGASPGPNVHPKMLPGVRLVWVADAEVATAALSGWHRAAIEAERVGLGSTTITA